MFVPENVKYCKYVIFLKLAYNSKRIFFKVILKLIWKNKHVRWLVIFFFKEMRGDLPYKILKY